MELADGELVARSKKGDREAFGELVLRYQKPIFNFVYRLLRHREEAQDVTQEVFLRAFRALDRYSPEQPFSAWLYKIANNLCIDVLRRRRNGALPLTTQTDQGEIRTEIPDHAHNPELLFAGWETRRAVEEAIASLPYKYRVVTILRHLQDLSYQEICAITGQPEGTVKAQIHRARRLLRARLSSVG